MWAPLCRGMYITGASLVLQEPSASKGHPVPNGRGTPPGQVGTRHTGTGTQGDLCAHGHPRFLLSGKSEGVLVWVWGLCAISRKK